MDEESRMSLPDELPCALVSGHSRAIFSFSVRV
jgi:hypothetical protein